ncbi:MAG: aminopeptidase P family protein [Lachnospiraceae bacterium]|nr:aminopeptidase P family protein [Lachnospiraceae bacterium]
MDNIYKKRIEELREYMKRDGIDYYIVYTSDSHMSEYLDDYYKFRDYLSGFTGSSGTLLVGMKEALLWTDGRYYIQAESELSGTGIRLYKMQEKGVPSLHEYLKDKASGKVIGVDGSHISEEEYEELVTIAGEGRVDNSLDYSEEVWQGRPPKTRNPIKILPESVCGKNMDLKIRDVIRRFTDRGADACIITDLADIMWIFNIRGSDIKYTPVAYSYAFITKQKALLFVDRGAACNELYARMGSFGNTIRPYEDIYTGLNFPEKARIACDKRLINSSVYASLAKNNEMIDIRHYELVNKAVKNKTEIRNSEKYHIKDGAAVIRWIFDIKRRVNDGEKLTEHEAAGYVDELRGKIRGSRGPSFETICAYNENGAIVHYAPKKEESKVLKPEGFLLLDSGGQYNGATTDITRTIALGRLSEEMKKDYTTVLKAHLRLMKCIFLQGTRGENLDVIAREPIWERYLDYRHGTGHGVGSFLSVHEGPQAFRYQIREGDVQPPLEPGMITSDEPGIYLEGKYGIRLENLLLCVEKRRNEWGTFLGFSPLTLVPFEREAIIPELLDSSELFALNEYHRLVYDSIRGELTDTYRDELKKACAEITGDL